MANSETKMKNFVGLSRQYYWVPDAQKSAASSSNPLGPFLYSGSLSSGWADRLIFDLVASYIWRALLHNSTSTSTTVPVVLVLR